MIIRPYEPTKDQDAVYRILYEVGWMEKGKEEPWDIFLAGGRSTVAEVNGSAECLVMTGPGSVRYLDEDVPLCGVAAVTASRVVRKQGLARRVTAAAIALDVAEGALVAGLGMFEQGYYNQIGFGTGSYELFIRFDPARLSVRTHHRIPRRLTADDWEAIYQARLNRLRHHGSVSLLPAAFTRGELLEHGGFGLGYNDGPNGTLSHYFWCQPQKTEHGPYEILWIVYRSREEFLELMSLLRSLGDQVRLVTLMEPPGVQMQDLMEQPFKQHQTSEKSPYEAGTGAAAWWQMRICDLAGCLAHTHLAGEPVRFNLQLSDPIAQYLDEGAPWRGVGGEYVVTLGPESCAVRGTNPALPTLTTTVNAFTRLWLGVRPATGLVYTDTLVGPPELLADLDRILRLPQPKIDWDL